MDNNGVRFADFFSKSLSDTAIVNCPLSIVHSFL